MNDLTYHHGYQACLHWTDEQGQMRKDDVTVPDQVVENRTAWAEHGVEFPTQEGAVVVLVDVTEMIVYPVGEVK